MKAKLANTLLITIIGTLLFAVPALSTIVEHMTVERLSEIATLVVLGEVRTVDARWNKDQTKIYTHISLSPTEILKGDQRLTDVHIKQIGGTVGETAALLPGSPTFEPEEQVLLFLENRKDGDGYMVIGLYQGKYKVVKELTDGEQILQRDVPHRGISIVDSTGKPTTEKHTLSEVRAIVKGGTR